MNSSERMTCLVDRDICIGTVRWTSVVQCRINNRRKCSIYYGPRAFRAPAVLCVKFVFYYM